MNNKFQGTLQLNQAKEESADNLEKKIKIKI